VVVVPEGFGGDVRWAALALAATLWLLLSRSSLELHWVLALAALAGLGLHAAGLA
jgi:hypothetical protein